MPRKGRLKQEIIHLLQESKQSVSLAELYKKFPEYTPGGIRCTVYRMRDRGLLEREHKKPSIYKMRKLRINA